MKKLIVFFIIILVMFAIWPKPKTQGSLVSSQTLGVTKVPTIEQEQAPPINAPKTYSFDKNTDLKAEWESVNPQILTEDFE